jgi:hypothetical protein
VAVSLRELFLLVRAEDHASKQLRTIGGSLRALSKATDVAAQSARMQAKANALEAGLADRRNKIAETQRLIQSKQAKIKQFPAENARSIERLNNLTANRNYAERQLMNNIQNRAKAQKDVADRVERRAKADMKLAERRFRQEGLRAQQLSGAKRKEAPLIAARAKTMEAQEMEKLRMAEQKLRIGFQTSDLAARNYAQTIGKGVVAQTAFKDSVRGTEGILAAQKAQLKEAEIAAAEYNAQMEKFNRQAPTLAKLNRRSALGAGMAGVGRTAMFAGGAAAVGLGFAASSAAKLSTSTTLAATQAITKIEQVGSKAKAVQDGILQQMTKFPAAAEEMSKSIFEIFSGTNIQQTSKGLQLMKVFNQAAVAGQSDLNTATQAVSCHERL